MCSTEAIDVDGLRYQQTNQTLTADARAQLIVLTATTAFVPMESDEDGMEDWTGLHGAPVAVLIFFRFYANLSAHAAVFSTKTEDPDNSNSNAEVEFSIYDTGNDNSAVTLAVFGANIVTAIAIPMRYFTKSVKSIIKLAAMRYKACRYKTACTMSRDE